MRLNTFMGARKKMTLPTVTDSTAFDRFNARLCIVTFEDVLSLEQQQRLNQLVEKFNLSSPGGKLKPRYSLTFDGPQVTIRQASMTEAPTKPHFDGLMNELEFNIPDVSTSTTTSLPAINRRNKEHVSRRASR